MRVYVYTHLDKYIKYSVISVPLEASLSHDEGIDLHIFAYEYLGKSVTVYWLSGRQKQSVDYIFPRTCVPAKGWIIVRLV